MNCCGHALVDPNLSTGHSGFKATHGWYKLRKKGMQRKRCEEGTEKK